MDRRGPVSTVRNHAQVCRMSRDLDSHLVPTSGQEAGIEHRVQAVVPQGLPIVDLDEHDLSLGRDREIQRASGLGVGVSGHRGIGGSEVAVVMLNSPRFL